MYSVGLDGQDNGGNIGKIPNTPGTDLGFRLWDVKHRGQPPSPVAERSAPIRTGG